MNPMIVLLFALDLVSLMLAVILATAWKSFGRPAHALSWSAGFAVAAIGWTLQIVVARGESSSLLLFLIGVLSMATWGLLLRGFRQRCRKPIGLWRGGVGFGASVALLGYAVWSSNEALRFAMPLLFSAAMLSLSAGTMMFRAGSPAERTVITMLLAFAILDAVGAASLLLGKELGGADELAFCRALVLLTLPSAFTGTGLFAVFLLAADLAARMGKLAACDSLTGIFNRRGFEEAATRAIATARRQGQPLTVVVVDIDRFKSINDRYGHSAGDAVLCRFARHVAGTIRGGDLFGRIGGEEFAILLVDTAPGSALEAIDRIRAGVADLEVPSKQGRIRVTASFGVTGPSGPDDSLSAMLSRADEALYRSKIDGRNRVTLAPMLAMVSEQARRAA